EAVTKAEDWLAQKVESLQAKPAEPGSPPSTAASIAGHIVELAEKHWPQTPTKGNRPPPPLPKPGKAPDPPTISLQYSSPTSIFARTDQPFELTVRGAQFREGMQIFFDGAQLASRLVNENELHATIQPGMFSSAHSARIEVKDPSNPVKFFSNQLNFQIQEPPKPGAQYIGWVGDKGGRNPKALLLVQGRSGEERQLIPIGEVIEMRFKITAINPEKVHLVDTLLSGVGYDLPLQGLNGSTGVTPPMAASANSSQPYVNYETAGEAPPERGRPFVQANGQEIRGQRIDNQGRALTREEILRNQEEVRKSKTSRVNQ
ncbi:MAG TPA: hypothetical protein PKE58_24790, partial [Acidobacteriota bacterium]|nr:hypothetical protein [Acidobacteriota bacterium]